MTASQNSLYQWPQSLVERSTLKPEKHYLLHLLVLMGCRVASAPLCNSDHFNHLWTRRIWNYVASCTHHRIRIEKMLTLGYRCGQRTMGDGAAVCSGNFLANPVGVTPGQTDFTPPLSIEDGKENSCAVANGNTGSRGTFTWPLSGTLARRLLQLSVQQTCSYVTTNSREIN